MDMKVIGSQGRGLWFLTPLFEVTFYEAVFRHELQKMFNPDDLLLHKKESAGDCQGHMTPPLDKSRRTPGVGCMSESSSTFILLIIFLFIFTHYPLILKIGLYECKPLSILLFNHLSPTLYSCTVC